MRLINEDKLDEVFYSELGGENKEGYDFLKKMLADVGLNYFRLGCDFIKRELLMEDCIVENEHTLEVITELNRRLINEEDCVKIIEYWQDHIMNRDKEKEKENDKAD